MFNRRSMVVSLVLAFAPALASASAVGVLKEMAPADADVPVATVAGVVQADLVVAAATGDAQVQRYTSTVEYATRADAQAAMDVRLTRLTRGGFIILESQVQEYSCRSYDSCFNYYIDFIASVRLSDSGRAGVTPVRLTLGAGRELVEVSDRVYETQYEARQAMLRVVESLTLGGWRVTSAETRGRTNGGFGYRVGFTRDPRF